MSIKQEDIKRLEDALKLEAGTLSNALSSEEEVTIELPELIIRTKDENETFVNNLKNEAKAAGVEMAVKEARNNLGLEFEGKTIENLLDAHGKKVVADKKAELGEPNKRIEELTADVSKLQNVVKEKDTAYETLQNQIKQTENARKLDTKLMGLIPDNITLKKEQVLTLFKSEYDTSLAEDGENIVIKKDGVQLKNDLLEPIQPKDLLTTFTNPFIKQASGGGGGDDEGASGAPGSYESFAKEMEDQGHKPGSDYFNREMQKRIANNTLKM